MKATNVMEGNKHHLTWQQKCLNNLELTTTKNKSVNGYNDFESLYHNSSENSKTECNSKSSLVERDDSNRQSICWYDFPEEGVHYGFCDDTSLHGIQYLAKSGLHILERLFWVIAFSLSLVLAGHFIALVFSKYANSPVVVAFQSYETFVDELPFPAVTICNVNNVLKSKAETYIRDAKGDPTSEKTISARKNVFYLDHVCKTTHSFSRTFNFSSHQYDIDQELLESIINETDTDTGLNVARFLRTSSQECKSMIKLCLWQDEVHDCSDLFNPIETNFGKCCVFNQLPQSLLLSLRNDSRDTQKEIEEWSPWNELLNAGSSDGLLLTGFDKPLPRRQRRAGKSSGLSIILNPDLDEYFCTSSDSSGFRLATHLPTDVPHVTDFGIAIQPNTEVFTSVRPDMTLSDDDVGTYDLDKRNCYVRDEFKLHYYTHYTAINCFDECIANITYKECKCVQYYMPRDRHRKLCGPHKYRCAEEVKRSTFVSGVESICGFCKPTCTELSYSSDTTSSRLLPDIWMHDNGTLAEWADNNVSIVHVFFGKQSSYAKVRSQIYGWTDLVSNVGGLLGLCNGFSLLSFIELVYYYTIRAWFSKIRRNQLREEEQQQGRSDPSQNDLKSYFISYKKPESVTNYENNINEGKDLQFFVSGNNKVGTVKDKIQITLWTTESSKIQNCN